MKHRLLGSFSLVAALLISSNIHAFNSVDKSDIIGPAPINEFSSDPKGALLNENSEETSDIVVPKKIKIHFQLDDGNYAKKRFWIWAGDYDPHIEYEADGIDEYGMFITFDTEPFGPHEEFGFLVLDEGNFTTKTDDCILNYEKFPPDKDGLLEVWCYPEQSGAVAVFKTIEETMGGKILSADFADWKTIKVKCSDFAIRYRLYCFNKEYFNYTTNQRRFHKERFLIKSFTFDTQDKDFDINFLNMTPASVVYSLEVDFKDINVTEPNEDGSIVTKTKMKFVSMQKLYDTPRFNTYYCYDGDDLGAVYSQEKTTFKVWAPVCANVNLKIFDGGTPHQHKNFDLYKMNYLQGGIWSCEVEGDLNGKYYTYTVNNSAGEAEVVDPYAKTTGIDGHRGMILDFSTTNPDGWDEIPLVWDGTTEFDLKQPNDLTVYETHIRDLTMDDSWKGTSKAGTFNAFSEKGTTYTKNNVTVKTGFDHIEELGVNAVQILPFFDQKNRESDTVSTNNKIDTPYNWGYNPENFNVPEGAYSSNPYDGATRVKELKRLVQAFATNKNHTRIIMDVVYNHVASVTTSNFNLLTPKYSFRLSKEGKYMNSSGCGNDVKTEAKMMRKFIVDSVKWWATEYKIKGFRFDLMGLIDIQTMRQVKDELYKIDKDIVCYGEGWPWPDQNGYPHNGTYTDKIYSELYPSSKSPGILGGFSDTFRNAIRGSNSRTYENNPYTYPANGFINPENGNTWRNAEAIAEGIRGSHKGKGGNPYQTVNYASCHDNFSLFDQLYWTLSEDNGVTEPDLNNIMESILAVQSAVAFSNGIAFFYGGEEVLRSKLDPNVLESADTYTMMYGNKVSHNSYMSEDATNALDYGNKVSMTYKGEEVDTTGFYAQYVKMIHERSKFVSRFPYSADKNPTGVWYPYDGSGNEHNPEGAHGLGVYWNYNGAEYWMLMSGSKPVKIGFDSANRSTCIYNSLGEGNNYTLDGKTINMSARQFLVFKAN